MEGWLYQITDTGREKNSNRRDKSAELQTKRTTWRDGRTEDAIKRPGFNVQESPSRVDWESGEIFESKDSTAALLSQQETRRANTVKHYRGRRGFQLFTEPERRALE